MVASVIQATIAHRLVKERAQRAGGVQLLANLPDLHECLLNEVESNGAVPREPVCVANERVVHVVEKLLQCTRVRGADSPAPRSERVG